MAHPSRALSSPSALSGPGQWGRSGQWAVLVGSDGRIQSWLSFQRVSGHCLLGEGLSEELDSRNYLEKAPGELQTCNSLSAAGENVSAAHLPSKGCEVLVCACSEEHVMLRRS